ncbi:hypothetical protein Esi_0182_0052 [Ectocarpus siliculosus]|uniref:Uncharacterized protein n=1 Tax=Ectocarpus siliculosus TaxID=2880 RepID=D8LH00_ECTSI|nr:hypothetical protein Esi_0182_0052 [Ectocarpus siliculosus]|eukprot:CBN75853.1 hypothetical protein Esi_0182_0052 [Ectocarpus siliculosus]
MGTERLRGRGGLPPCLFSRHAGGDATDARRGRSDALRESQGKPRNHREFRFRFRFRFRFQFRQGRGASRSNGPTGPSLAAEAVPPRRHPVLLQRLFVSGWRRRRRRRREQEQWMGQPVGREASTAMAGATG